MKYFDYKQILSNGITIHSSGTTNQPIPYFQSPEKIKTANKIGMPRQQISKSSKVYTCCKLSYAGGLLAQTLPVLEIDADDDIGEFNAYTFVKK